jgi:hypothetical protein
MANFVLSPGSLLVPGINKSVEPHHVCIKTAVGAKNIVAVFVKKVWPYIPSFSEILSSLILFSFELVRYCGV